MAIKNRYALMTDRGDVIAFFTSLAEARGSKKSLERGFGKRQTLSERPRKGLWIKDGETGSAVPSDQKNPRGVKLPSRWTNAKVPGKFHLPIKVKFDRLSDRWRVYEGGDTVGQFKTKAEASKYAARVRKQFGALVRKEKKGPGSAKNPRVKLPSKWTNAKVRVDAKGNVQIGLAKNPFRGKGGTLAKGVKSVKGPA